MPTLIVQPEELESDEVVVSGDEYRHLFRALRLREGERIRVVDGAGRARGGVVESVEELRASVKLEESRPSREASCRIELAVAQLRPERARWLVEKATELGVDEIVWFESSRSQQRWPDRLYGRLERVARSAVEQSGRACLPRVDRLASFEELLRRISRDRRDGVSGDRLQPPTLLAHPYDSARSVADLEPSWIASGRCRIVIGPEGGFTREEIAQALAAGATTVLLGERILRVETAAIALLAAVIQAA